MDDDKINFKYVTYKYNPDFIYNERIDNDPIINDDDPLWGNDYYLNGVDYADKNNIELTAFQRMQGRAMADQLNRAIEDRLFRALTDPPLASPPLLVMPAGLEPDKPKKKKRR